MSQFIALDMLPSALTAHTLYSLVSIFPGVVGVDFVPDSQGRSVGSAVVETTNSAHTDVMIGALDGLEILGQSLRASRLDVREMALA